MIQIHSQMIFDIVHITRGRSKYDISNKSQNSIEVE